MKKLILNAAFCGFASLLFVTSCANEGNKRPVTTIKSSSSGQPTMKIEYLGTIKLNDLQTVFKSISADGYVKYQKGNHKLIVEYANEGRLLYTIDDNPKQLNLSESEKNLVADAIQDMIENGAKFQ